MAKSITFEHVEGVITGLKFGVAGVGIALGFIQLIIGGYLRLIHDRIKKLECSADVTTQHNTDLAIVRERVHNCEDDIKKMMDIDHRLTIVEIEHKNNKGKCG